MPKGDATWPTMTIEECLAFADEWSRGMTIHAGSQGWRVVCMLLAEEVRGLRAAIRQTLDENAHLETKVAMLERALAESQARELRLRAFMCGFHDARLDAYIATIPCDNSALREMIEAEREACAKVCDNRHMFMGDDADRAVEGCAAAIRYRNVESC